MTPLITEDSGSYLGELRRLGTSEAIDGRCSSSRCAGRRVHALRSNTERLVAQRARRCADYVRRVVISADDTVRPA
jgi:hypothetical protein